MLNQNQQTLIRIAGTALQNERWMDFESVYGLIKGEISTARFVSDIANVDKLEEASEDLYRKYRVAIEATDMTDWIQTDGGRADAGYKGLTGDCVVRACAIAFSLPYKEVWEYFKNDSEEENWTPSNGVESTSSSRFLRDRGWEVKPSSGTVREVAKTIGDGIIDCHLMGDGHFVAVRNFKYLDQWNSGQLKVKAIWQPFR